MNCDVVNEHIERFLEDALDPATRRGVEAHLHECRVCRGVVEFRRSLQTTDTATSFIPRSPEFTPAIDPWPELQARPLRSPRSPFPSVQSTPPLPRPPMMRLWLPLMAAAAMALGAALFWPRDDGIAAWNVTPIAGKPDIGAGTLGRTDRLEVGEWLSTDHEARARLSIGTIGELQVEPESKLRIVSAATRDHRVELERGTVFALVWAAPRLFSIKTPAATVVDLGCAYTLSVEESGTTTVNVTAGHVALELGDRVSVVPAGMKCVARKDAGPGTPFATGAPAGLRDALTRYDFERGGDTALSEVLVYADEDDKVTLWHLLHRTTPMSRAAVYDRLAALHSPPDGVTREGVISGHPEMLRRWGLDLGVAGK